MESTNDPRKLTRRELLLRTLRLTGATVKWTSIVVAAGIATCLAILIARLAWMLPIELWTGVALFCAACFLFGVLEGLASAYVRRLEREGEHRKLRLIRQLRAAYEFTTIAGMGALVATGICVNNLEGMAILGGVLLVVSAVRYVKERSVEP